MNDDFVPFELAIKLGEKGFRELCLAYYTNHDILYYNYYQACCKDCCISHNSMPKDSVGGKFVDAPTILQVLKWLRKEKLILTGLSPMQEYGDDEVIALQSIKQTNKVD